MDTDSLQSEALLASARLRTLSAALGKDSEDRRDALDKAAVLLTRLGAEVTNLRAVVTRLERIGGAK